MFHIEFELYLRVKTEAKVRRLVHSELPKFDILSCEPYPKLDGVLRCVARRAVEVSSGTSPVEHALYTAQAVSTRWMVGAPEDCDGDLMEFTGGAVKLHLRMPGVVEAFFRLANFWPSDPT